MSGVVLGPSSRLDLRARRRARCQRLAHSARATLVLVGFAMHDEQVKDGKMMKLTSIARAQLECGALVFRRPPSASLRAQAALDVLPRRRRRRRRGRAQASSAGKKRRGRSKGKKTLEVDIDRRPQDPTHVIWARMGANVSPAVSVSV